jgi:hypothetical protein
VSWSRALRVGVPESFVPESFLGARSRSANGVADLSAFDDVPDDVAGVLERIAGDGNQLGADEGTDLGEPGRRLNVHMRNERGGRCEFDATLTLTRRPLNGPALAHALVAYPLMTARVTAAIYWQALRLWLKGARYHPPPPDDNQAVRPEQD